MNHHVTPSRAYPKEVEERLAEIERVLKFDPQHPDKRQLVREYIEKTDPQQEPDF